MNKNGLITAIMARTGFNKKTVMRFIEAFTETTAETLKAGGKVQISMFGRFETVRGKERTGINPQTGENLSINPPNRIKFTAGKALKETVNNIPTRAKKGGKMGEQWKVFYNSETGAELCAYTIRGTFDGEEDDTRALLAHEKGIPAEQIKTRIESR